MVGPLTIENLEKIQNFSRGQMPESFCRELRRLRAKKDRLDNERLREDVVPIYDYPVKVKLFKHQLRGANMAMITFDEAEGGGYESSGNSQI